MFAFRYDRLWTRRQPVAQSPPMKITVTAWGFEVRIGRWLIGTWPTKAEAEKHGNAWSQRIAA